jgi:hypothetical protein
MDLRREVSHIRRQYDVYKRELGEVVVWYEFIPFGDELGVESMYDSVYDEGPSGLGGRRYKPGVVVPVLLITESEDQRRAIPEGRQPVQVINGVGNIVDFKRAGINQPHEYKPHLDDMFSYDGRYYYVDVYKVRGRMRDDIMIVFEGIEVFPEQEMVNDPGPQSFVASDLPWPSTLAY